MVPFYTVRLAKKKTIQQNQELVFSFHDLLYHIDVGQIGYQTVESKQLHFTKNIHKRKKKPPRPSSILFYRTKEKKMFIFVWFIGVFGNSHLIIVHLHYIL